MKYAIPAIIAAPLVVWLVMTDDPQDPYCDMVKVFEETGGEYGWPPFREHHDCGDK